MKQTALFFVFLLTLLSSCCNKTCQKTTESNALDSLVLVDTTEMKSAFWDAFIVLLSNILRIVRLFLNVDMDTKTMVFIQMVSISTVTFCYPSCLL